MAIIDTFDDKTDAIINPSQIAPPIDGFPKVAVVAFSERMIIALNEHYETTLIDKMTAVYTIPIYQITFEGKEIAVYCSPLGGPCAGGLLEEMISKGCEKFVFFGSCGVLDREIAAKSLIVPTAAYRDEGTSYHYMPPGDYIEVATAPKLTAILTKLNLPHVCGKTWTTDAFYRETRGNMEKRKNEGCITVEMECASIMAVAQFRDVDVYQFLYAADSLDEVEWDSRTLGSLPKDDREKFLRIALEIATYI
ncbi:MAG: nucleoside phosphorylase [Oscillospiraceae bacterium]|nr:nucleoside phosphorylase [Oscillospiraceae bacterium]